MSSFFQRRDQRPLVYGHRGAKAYAPMNTLPAFELAAEQGADGVELDVWLSQDRQLVVIHDHTVDGTTNGTGLVEQMTLDALKSLDAGVWFDARFAGTPIPTLDEVFQAVGQRLIVNVEIKTADDSLPPTNDIERSVADCIARHQMAERVIVSSFNPYVLKRFREIAPQIPLGYLYAADYRPASEVMASVKYEALHPHHTLIDAAYMAWANEQGCIVNTWTVNERERMETLIALGVHGIISDKPDLAREVVNANHR
jgi:glycerophosphoryl diester phosphodiesterase